jgi:predicted GNAT family acetyltransferase
MLMPEQAPAVEVVDNRARDRYEATIDGHLAQLVYHRTEGVIDLRHTEVPEALEGRGIAGKLASFALDAARADGLRVIPSCPYVRAYIERHQEYADLVR